MTSRTSAIAVDIASDKALTNQLLASAGLPVPRSETVDDEEGAVRAAQRIGFPVVVKPLDGNHGRGVCLDLRSEEDVRKAFPVALRESRGGDVVVETYVHGADHRVLVIGGRMVAVAERVPAGVTGGRRAHRRASSWTSRTRTPAAASATRRCSPGSPSTRPPRSSSRSRA